MENNVAFIAFVPPLIAALAKAGPISALSGSEPADAG